MATTIYITARHMEGGSDHEHIAAVRWCYVGSTQVDWMSTAQAVEWIDEGGEASVDGYPSSVVGTVAGNPKFLRSHADGSWNNNLLALPRY